MKIFISGATGFIGSRLALRLADQGNTIHALYRSENKTSVLNHPNIRLFKGDILDKNSIENAIRGCDQVYHTAAFAKIWDRDPSQIYRLNIEGCLNVVNAGITAGVKRFVITSTAGVLGPSGKEKLIDENSPKPADYFIDYESSKALMEDELKNPDLANQEIIVVNPTRVYGPGILSESNSVTRMIKDYVEGRWHIIPGNGKSTGNYVFVEDVVSGHILAMEKGGPGERYILGGENISFNDFFRELSVVSGKKTWMIHIPVWLMLLLSRLVFSLSILFGKDPPVTPSLIRRYSHFWNLSSAKAMRKISYAPMGVKEGMKITIRWINEHN
ncbi:MAG: NAD-dependent epimerase/dehydratase family protein [Bacteroidales bacterium]|nr:NAD-dependent epimerase/dehydratase family protein [Bacteroidales bacterium]MCB9000197.1 NAD-dependent epimerase/dehydratase family protein [Bacteroidales bacterium]MCB9013724.1 NAD-dependent epimerase/dehydratase family protein [Bacteroidales bacterium]